MAYRRKDRDSSLTLVKKTLNLDPVVYDRIRELYTDVDVAHAIRLILKGHVAKVEAQIAAAQPIADITIQIEGLPA